MAEITVGNDTYRAKIMRDEDASRPDKDMDLVIGIEGMDSHYDVASEMCHHITSSKAWEVVEQTCAATNTDLPDIHDQDVREQWLEAIRDEVLVRQVRAGYNGRYVVHTTPDMCAKLGVDWANAEKAMDQEIEMLVQWCDGDIYGYTIEKAHGCDHCGHIEWETVDSCWGFYGDDIDKNGMIDNLPSDMHAVLRAAEWVN
jgi:hypothetical protein